MKTNLKKNINNYMKLKGIKNYTNLLINIAYQLGIKGNDAYKFAAREKSNFSKMLNGSRPLKYEFIIPLESIFGVSLAKLLNEEAYKLPIEKDMVPFIKGFSYYAYKDDPLLYKNEFDRLITRDGETIFTRLDEFGKGFLDYVVEYNSINGLLYLYEEYGIKLKFYNRLSLTKSCTSAYISFNNFIFFARLVASLEDEKIFFDIFDTFYLLLTNGHYCSNSNIYCQNEFLEIILDEDKLFKSILETQIYDTAPIKSRMHKDINTNTNQLCSISPIVNNCLTYALLNLEKYKEKAISILKFGIDYNQKLINKFGHDLLIINELGGLASTPCYYCDIDAVGVLIDQKKNERYLNR